MANMEFWKQNQYNTTGVVKVDSNTATAQFLFDRSTALGYSSSGYNSITGTIISVEFSTPTVISGVFIQNHNLKQFRVFYNSATANTFSTPINETTNSATSSYFFFNSVTVSSIQLQMDDTIAGSVEKSVGEFVVSERRLRFERNPTAGNYKRIIDRKQIRHIMPDGGTSVYNIKDKLKANIKLGFISDSFTSQLETAFVAAKPMYFLPFPTTSAWDGKAYEVNWVRDFNFNYGEDSKTQGQSGDLDLEETSNA